MIGLITGFKIFYPSYIEFEIVENMKCFNILMIREMVNRICKGCTLMLCVGVFIFWTYFALLGKLFSVLKHTKPKSTYFWNSTKWDSNEEFTHTVRLCLGGIILLLIIKNTICPSSTGHPVLRVLEDPWAHCFWLLTPTPKWSGFYPWYQDGLSFTVSQS